uniref:Reverse transcriptase domain-containing protein n=1 Tax=Angiostrongylus cantonensis TaxID=6313 RepID=A0A0K0D3K7_ANGCA
MLADFDEACGKIGLRLNLKKTMFMKNGLVSCAPFTLNGTNISECSSYVYLGQEINMMNNLAQELNRRKRAAWGAFKSIEDVVKRTKNTRLCAHLFESTFLPVLTYASETWSLRKQDERSLSITECAVDKVMIAVSRFIRVREGIRSSDLRERSKNKDAVMYAKQSKIRCVGQVMRMTGSLGRLNVLQEIHRPDRHSSSRRAKKKDMMLDEFLERAGLIGLLLDATRKNGRFTGASSIHWTINGTTDDTGDTKKKGIQIKVFENGLFRHLAATRNIAGVVIFIQIMVMTLCV